MFLSYAYPTPFSRETPLAKPHKQQKVCILDNVCYNMPYSYNPQKRITKGNLYEKSLDR